MEFVEERHTDHGGSPGQNSRELVWTSNRTFQGWMCSQCDWNYPLPTLLNDPEAKTAYDRLAASKYRDHKCSDHLLRAGSASTDGFTGKIRKLVAQGFKPKDAVELMLQEVALECRNEPATLAQAQTAADDFLRRLRAGII